MLLRFYFAVTRSNSAVTKGEKMLEIVSIVIGVILAISMDYYVYGCSKRRKNGK